MTTSDITIGLTGPDWEPTASNRYFAQRGDRFAFGPTETAAHAALLQAEGAVTHTITFKVIDGDVYEMPMIGDASWHDAMIRALDFHGVSREDVTLVVDCDDAAAHADAVAYAELCESVQVATLAAVASKKSTSDIAWRMIDVLRSARRVAEVNIDERMAQVRAAFPTITHEEAEEVELELDLAQGR